MKQSIDPIRRNVTVPLDPERAFTLFTEGMHSWWPVQDHSRSASETEGESVKTERGELQTRKGGRIVEHPSNGVGLPWAEILVWEPPHRFVMAWKPHARPQPPTEVEVTFTPSDEGTLVELEHRGWERLSEDIT